jgi:hypothetical protein
LNYNGRRQATTPRPSLQRKVSRRTHVPMIRGWRKSLCRPISRKRCPATRSSATFVAEPSAARPERPAGEPCFLLARSESKSCVVNPVSSSEPGVLFFRLSLNQIFIEIQRFSSPNPSTPCRISGQSPESSTRRSSDPTAKVQALRDERTLRIRTAQRL